jgi:transposase-like protein
MSACKVEPIAEPKPEPLAVSSTKIECPHCHAGLQAPKASEGQEFSCPSCHKRFVIPAYKELEIAEDEDPGIRPVARVIHTEDRPSRRRRERDDVEEYDDERDERPLRRGYRCPYCGSTMRPLVRQQISQTGWIVFALLLIFTVCLFWIGLLIKEDVRICPDCGMRLPS